MEMTNIYCVTERYLEDETNGDLHYLKNYTFFRIKTFVRHIKQTVIFQGRWMVIFM